MKIVITGANGFVGASLCRYFYHQGYEIIAMGRQKEPPEALLRYASYISADITQPVDPFEADICIHSAALASDTASYKDLYLNNVEGTKHVAEAAKNCKYFIQISSSSVYRFNNISAKESDALLTPSLSYYGQTKLHAENVLKLRVPSFQQRVILRPRAIYGIGDRLLLPRLLSLKKAGIIISPSNKSLKTSLTHIENIADAILLCLKHNGNKSVETYNIADEPVYVLNDVMKKIIFAIEKRPLKMIPIPDSSLKIIGVLNLVFRFSKKLSPLSISTFTQSSMLDISKIKRELNYSPVRCFEDSMQEIADWIDNLGGKTAYFKNLNLAPWK